MRTRLTLVGALLASATLLAACGAYSAPAGSAGAYGGGAAAKPTSAVNAPSTAAVANAPSGPGSIAVADSSLGKILVDGKGRTLYIFTKDQGSVSSCYDKCAVNWPHLPAVAQDQVGAGVTASLLGTSTRTDGSVQATYNGMPLYYYAPDTQPGDVKGQGVGGVWYVVSPDGTPIK